MLSALGVAGTQVASLKRGLCVRRQGCRAIVILISRWRFTLLDHAVDSKLPTAVHHSQKSCWRSTDAAAYVDVKLRVYMRHTLVCVTC